MTIVRPRFTEGQFVGFEDLVAEQAHRDEAARRHHTGHHGWGVVAGLALVARPGGFTVEPGYAVDGYGRRLIVADPIDVDVDEASSSSRDVWLRLSGRAAGDAISSVCLVPPGVTDPRCPPGVPARAHGFAPHDGVPPSTASWPVYLGRVMWDGDEVTASDDRRVSAGLTGESVRAPSGRASLQVGVESAGDPRRFAVLTEVVPPPSDDGEAPETLPPSPQLVVDRKGDVEVCGTSELNGDVKVTPSAHLPRDAHAGVGFGSATLPGEASPWTVYRTRVDRDERTINQLRVEIAYPGDDGEPARNRFVLGIVDKSASTPFTPCLTVDANCQVTVHNDLEVEGLLVEGVIDADPTDPRFAAAAAERFVQGSVGGANQADAFYAAEVTVTVTSDQAPVQGTTFAYKVSVEVGAAALTNGQVHVVIGIGGSQVLATQPLNGATFAAGSTRELALTFQVPGDTSNQQLVVSAMALATGPASNVVSDSGALETTIQSQIG